MSEQRCRHHVAIIGAGPSGLATARALKDEAGVDDFVVLETADSVGGVWRGPSGGGLAWDGMTTNLSKEKCEFHGLRHDDVNRHHASNAQLEGPVPDFPTAAHMRRYFETFTDVFHLRRHIRFGAKVVSCVRDGDGGGGWLISTAAGAGVGGGGGGGDSHRQLRARFLVVCTNVWCEPHVPSEVAEAAGRVGARLWHAGDLRGLIGRDNADDGNDAPRRVLVVGAAYSGPDIASRLCREPASSVAGVAVMTRDPKWFLSRWAYRRPSDDAAAAGGTTYGGGVRFASAAADGGELSTAGAEPWDRLVELRTAALDGVDEPYAHPKPNHDTRHRWATECLSELYGDQPATAEVQLLHPPSREAGDRSDFSMSDSFAADVMAGRIALYRCPSIADVPQLETYTDVVAATGYRAALPFLDPWVLEEEAEFDATDPTVPLILYKGTLPQHPQHHGRGREDLAFVGCVRGAYLSTIEQQARWVAALVSKRVAWPTSDDARVAALIEHERGLRKAARAGSGFQFPHPNTTGFTDSIAQEFGCRPPPTTTPEGARLLGTPVTGSHYRVRPFPSATSSSACGTTTAAVPTTTTT